MTGNPKQHTQVRRSTVNHLSISREVKLKDLIECLWLGLDPVGYRVKTYCGHYELDSQDYFNYLKTQALSKYDVEVTKRVNQPNSHSKSYQTPCQIPA